MLQAEEVLRVIEKLGGEALAVTAEVGDEDSLLRGFETVDKAGPLDVLVNNAGITDGLRLQDVTAAALGEVSRVNVVGVFLAVRESPPRLHDRYSIHYGTAQHWPSMPLGKPPILVKTLTYSEVGGT